MTLDAGKVRSAVESTLKEKKSLTEREVKSAVARLLKVEPADVAVNLIRQVRKTMGIDRPSAIAFARQLVRKNPTVPAREVIEGVAGRFGVRIGAPDVSRMRPEKSKRATGRRAGKAARPRRAAAKAGKAAGGAKARVKGTRGRKAARSAKRVQNRASAASTAPVPLLKIAAAGLAGFPSKGAVRVSFDGTGRPDDLARFFLSLGKKR